MQGFGLSEVAYQNALAYAKDRLQGRALTGTKNPEGPADPILVHPDVRKGLLRIKALQRGGARAGLLDRHADRHRAPSPRRGRARGGRRPGRAHDAGHQGLLHRPRLRQPPTSALQTLGGHGYIREYGIEQYVRDARIAQIYEGTNAIQALDLVGRKLPMHGGRLVRRFFAMVKADIDAVADDDTLAALAKPVGEALVKLQKATMLLAEKGFANPDEAGAVATDYLHLMGYTALGWQWLRMAGVAQRKLTAGEGDARFLGAKLKTARFYMAFLMPETHALLARIQAGAGTIMALSDAEF